MAPQDKPPAGQQRPPSQSGQRREHPGNVRMPSPPPYPRHDSPSYRGNKNLSSPGNSPGLSPSMSGPLSPSSSKGQQSFIFPIRSVYQGMNQSDSPGEHSGSLSRGGSNSFRYGNQGDDGRRQSISGHDPSSSDVVGISTIAQMLEDSKIPSNSSDPRNNGPASATFTGDKSKERKNQSAHHGFFSVPLQNSNESAESPFFNDQRRASDPASSPEPLNDDKRTDTSSNPSSRRPEAPRGDSGSTVQGVDNRVDTGVDKGVDNPSAEASGSGLPDKSRLPVGQPQRAPRGTNFHDRPGETTGDQQSYHERTARPPSRGSQPSTQQPELHQPKASRPANTRQAAASGSSASGSSNRRSSKHTHIETDEKGDRNLVADYSGIVRLDAGSLPSNMGDSATGDSRDRGKESGTGSIPSGPTNARLAHQSRTAKTNNTRNSVRDFVNSQAQTTNLLDPNAPTPSTTPHEEPASGPLQNASMESSTDREGEWPDSSDASMSVRDSSEVATAASGEEQADSEPEPIVTFRFEHVATDDGHHVVVGREGTLQRCEDEPITTPGAVQGFGVLLVLEDDYESGQLTVRQVSENATELLGLSPRYLFRLDCFTRVLTDDQEDILRDNIEYLPDTASGKGSVEEEGPQVFLLSGFGEPGSDDDEEDDDTEATGRRREWTCWVAAHRPKQTSWNKVDAEGKPIAPPDLIVLEFELEKDVYNPLMQTFENVPFSSGRDTPESGSQTDVSRGARSASTGSMDRHNSDGSLTTVGSTPMPPTSQGSDSGTIMRPSSNRNDSDPNHFGQSTKSSKMSGSHQPMGLDGVDVELPLERIIESTTNHAKPLRALERMRRTGQHGESSSGSGTASSSRRNRRARRPAGSATGTMDVFAVLGQINEQLGSAPDLETFLKITVGVVQDLCRFHRVLIYQFDETYNGQVVAELVEWGKTTDLFKGLMFPAADIPAQARQLYMINKVRLLYDRSQTTARMVLRSKEDLDNPLDMTHCYLRAMSPIHIKYLANMNVRSSMSVSIMAFGQLWGLIACHSYGHHGMRVSFPVRQMMRILSDSISRNIERLSYAHRLHTRKLISTIPSQHHPTGYIVSNADDLLQIFDADSGLLVIGDGCKLLGNNEQGTAMLAIAEFLRIMRFDSIKASNHLARDFPDLILPRAQDTIAGLLYVPLTAKAGQDFIVFLRKGQIREVQWAGKPYKDESADNGASLEPRKSFKTWSETVTGRSRVWTDDQLESAGVLALIYGKFIQVWREKQSAMASNQLTAILLSNTSHAVRTPLSQIINTLELALSGDIDDDTRSMLENSHQASRALLFHVHDLLDLTRIETGNETAFNDPFDIRQSIMDAIRLYQTEATRRELEFKVNMAEDLPRYVVGDSRKIKTVVSNLVANAIKFTDKGHVEIYCGMQGSEGHEVAIIPQGKLVPIEIVISDTGCGIPNDKLEAMFMTLEGAEEIRSNVNPGLGLGLAVVARIVEQLSGQLRAESEVGMGTRFFFTLPMRVQNEEPSSKDSSTRSVIMAPQRQSSGSGSVGSIRSRSASSSQGQSEIDDFVHDFASSHMLAPVGADDKRLRDAETRMNRPGTFPVTDSSFPVRPTRMDDQTEQSSSPPATSTPTIAQSPHQQRPSMQYNRAISYQSTYTSASQATSGTGDHHRGDHHRRPSHSQIVNKAPDKTKRSDTTNMRVLVVEDDPINSQILQKRLRMEKHVAIPVTNGQEAVNFLENDRDIDVVLMDIQMPIMDGRTAAKEIRKLEKRAPQPNNINPLRVDGRIPIFAVSASLYESDRANMAETFDGWMLKPLDFNRTRIILSALEDPAKRSKEVYVQGQWERGGYLTDARSASPGGTLSGNRKSSYGDN